MAGRAGHGKAGQVLIQSYNPDNYAIRFAKEQDYEGFYAYEMSIRRQLGYPPYYFTIGITLTRKKKRLSNVPMKSWGFLRSGSSELVKSFGPTPKTQRTYPQPLSLPALD